MRIYVHHWFKHELFIKLAHNTINRKYKLTNVGTHQIGNVYCEFNGLELEFIFNPELNDNEDGYHLIDFFTALRKRYLYDYYKDIDVSDGVEDTPFIKRFSELLDGKTGWIIMVLRTEKLIDTLDTNDYHILKLEEELSKLNNHIIVTDNFFINDKIKIKYPNMHFVLSNTIWQWNELINIRYWYEFSNIFSKLNFDYKLMYSVRRHKKYRIEILKNLAKLNHKDIFLQRADFFKNDSYHVYDSELVELKNVNLNSLEGLSDFQNLKLLDYQMGVEYEVFFRFLNLSKMQILDESWSWHKGDFTSQYLSEKSYGLLLSNIPFISTHTYPLDIIQKILNVEQHPFYNETKNVQGNSLKFSEFVSEFLDNFDYNYLLCKDWTDKCHINLIKHMESKNCFLELLSNKFETNSISYTKSLI